MSRALSAPGVGTPQPSTPLGRTPSAAPTVITFFAVALGVDVLVAVAAVVAGCEHLDQLLVADGARLRVAHELVVLGRARACTCPTRARCPVPHELFEMRAPPFQALVGDRAGREARGGAGAAEDLRDAELGERRHAEPVVEAGAVLVGRAGAGVVAGGDRRDVGAVPAAVVGVGVARVVAQRRRRDRDCRSSRPRGSRRAPGGSAPLSRPESVTSIANGNVAGLGKRAGFCSQVR